mmetsp:Transcript_63830/g.138285  ORF Transcript_63830/g.138285 Transcript_63830/m.138285 type:complete len:367 (+) Transcript_63830:343-1443(+)
MVPVHERVVAEEAGVHVDVGPEAPRREVGRLRRQALEVGAQGVVPQEPGQERARVRHAHAARDVVLLHLVGQALGHQPVAQVRPKDLVVVVPGGDHVSGEGRVLAAHPEGAAEVELVDEVASEDLLHGEVGRLGGHRPGHLQVEGVVRPRRARLELVGRPLVDLPGAGLRAVLLAPLREAGQAAAGVRREEAAREGEEVPQGHPAAAVFGVARPPREELVRAGVQGHVAVGHDPDDGAGGRELARGGHDERRGHGHVALLQRELPPRRVPRGEGQVRKREVGLQDALHRGPAAAGVRLGQGRTLPGPRGHALGQGFGVPLGLAAAGRGPRGRHQSHGQGREAAGAGEAGCHGVGGTGLGPGVRRRG